MAIDSEFEKINYSYAAEETSPGQKCTKFFKTNKKQKQEKPNNTISISSLLDIFFYLFSYYWYVIIFHKLY